MIYTIKDCFDENGRHVREYITVSGEFPEDFPKFVGVGMVEIQIGPRPIPRQYSANLNAKTIEEAFDNFDDIMGQAGEQAAKDLKEEADRMFSEQRKEEASKIVIPN